MAGLKSKWLGPKRRALDPLGTVARQSVKATVESTRWLPNKRGHKRKEIDTPTEVAYVERLTRRQPGWVNGARVQKPNGVK